MRSSGLFRPNVADVHAKPWSLKEMGFGLRLESVNWSQ